jgi:hypothetical protein
MRSIEGEALSSDRSAKPVWADVSVTRLMGRKDVPLFEVINVRESKTYRQRIRLARQ